MTSYLKTMLAALRQWITAQKADWSQNDETAANFIKGRPCYDTDPKMEYLVKDQAVTLEALDGLPDGWAAFQMKTLIALEPGKAYNVTWDGKQYSVIGQSTESDAIFIGNTLLLGGEDTGEPFVITRVGNMLTFVFGLGAGSHTFSVATMMPGKPVPLPAKYLPTIPAKKVSGLAGVATSGNYNDLTDTPIIPTDIVRYATSQSLNEAQKTQARDNIGAVSSSEITGVVRYTAQELTEEEKAQARINIGSVEISDIEKAKDYIALIDQINGYTYLVSMRNGNLVSSVGTKTIDITVMPTKTSYIHGEYFDVTGMIITAIRYDGTVTEITDYVYPTAYLTEGTTSVEIIYTEAGNTMTATVPITVSAFDPEVILVDFEYTDNGDGTYTITGWKGTYNGEASTEIIIPNNGAIRV